MRFLILVKASRDSEAGVMPEDKLIGEMAKYHEELVKAGALLDGSGLQPSSNDAGLNLLALTYRIVYAVVAPAAVRHRA